MALLTPALIGVSLIFKTGGIRADVKGAGVKKGPAEKGPIRYRRPAHKFRVTPVSADCLTRCPALAKYLFQALKVYIYLKIDTLSAL